MTPRSPPNESNYSTLIGKRMETVKQSLNEMIEKRLRNKHRILYNFIGNKAKINSNTKMLN